MERRIAVTSAAVALVLLGTGALAVAEHAHAATGAKAETNYEWSIKLDCTECHAKETASLENAEEKGTPSDKTASSKVDGYAVMHAGDFGLTCIDCHVDSDELAKGHKKLNSGKEAKRLKKSDVACDVCATCHNADDLVAKTADYKGLVDSNGTVVNPHHLPATESHTAITCTDCHQVHSGEPIAESAPGACTSCHHAGVYECGTCH